ncbi:GNAT family N-acetyltransferase [Phocaeicola plebeius]|uniref:GNAT family N-acetyltransferase n=1 Tax=Phocaeicola plebeius TaxID=310297 RepID=UPI00195A5ABE|nr:GNAT family N-acetyltransferase [Phocaeicola plebeius]MBM6842414.1 GNAT family N-acetyltransferase [Phocaeicola plebeius]
MKEAKTGKIEIETDRLIIRTPEDKDVHDIFVLMSDREIAASTGFRPMNTLSEAEGKIRREMDGGLMFCISEKNLPEKVLGVFEITPHKTNTVSGENCNYEICYFLHKEFRGKGYMTEVAERMKRYLFDERMADSLTIAVLPRNDASRRVALKSGFTYEGLEKKCGMNYLDEVVDLEYYTLYKEEYLNPDEKVRKEKQTIASKQKWINDGGILYPIPGYASLLTSPGNGIFRIYENPQTKRLGLEKIDDTFRFDFKIYDLDCEDIMSKIIKTWTSDLFRESNKNLGVIFNGIKGTGKTIAAKQLCNRIGLPVIVISKPVDGMLEFIQSLHFESIILIDEAEKTFREEQEVLLKMIDGVYNDMRKLYILTTNKLSIDENLLGRPGRIRYIKEFSNLSAKAVNDVIDDNLNDISLKDDVLKVVDSLEISTIDILKAIIDECNIMGSVPSDSTLNIPKAKYKIQIISFDNLELKFHRELQDYIINHLAADESVINWLQKVIGTDGKGKKFKKNLDLIEEMYDCRVCIEWRPTSTLGVYIGKHLGCGIVNSKPDGYGFFTREADWDNSTELCCLCNDYNIPSLYRGNL